MRVVVFVFLTFIASPVLFSEQQYVDTAYHFSFTYPDGWEILSVPNQPHKWLHGPQVTGGRPMISIFDGKLPYPSSMTNILWQERYLESFVSQLTAGLSRSSKDYHEISSDFIRTNYETVGWRLLYTSTYGETHLRTIQFYIQYSKSDLFQIVCTCPASTNGDLDEVFDTVVGSLHPTP